MFGFEAKKFGILLSLAIFVPCVHATNMPPKIQVKKYSWKQNLKQLAALKASEIILLSEAPVEHGMLEIDHSSPNRVRLFNGVGKESVVLGAGGAPAKTLHWQRASSFASKASKVFRNANGFYEWEDTKLKMFENSRLQKSIYSLDMGFYPLFIKETGGSIRAWRSEPVAEFFVLNRTGSRAYRVEWSDDSQIVDVVACSTLERRYLVVENVNNGLTRFVFLDADLNAVGYTIFDLAQNTGLGDVSRALVVPGSQCESVFLAGAFGVVKINYPRGSLN